MLVKVYPPPLFKGGIIRTCVASIITRSGYYFEKIYLGVACDGNVLFTCYGLISSWYVGSFIFIYSKILMGFLVDF